MLYDLWINLPVKDLQETRRFFTHLGFTFDTEHQTPTMLCMKVGRNKVVVMFIKDDVLKEFVENELATPATSEALFSIGVESREEVEELARKTTEAGGHVFSPPKEIQGWMYGCGIADPDGHRWNALYMDMDKMPKG